MVIPLRVRLPLGLVPLRCRARAAALSALSARRLWGTVEASPGKACDGHKNNHEAGYI